MSQLELFLIRTDGATQPRASLNHKLIEEYAEAMRAGTKFPPVTVFYDGVDYWLADGFHRLTAAQKTGVTTIAVDVRQGTCRDAVLYSVGANAMHGLRRSHTDKRRAVLTLFNDSEWSRWSNNEIAKRCCVAEGLVRKLKEELSSHNTKIDQTYARKCGIDEETLKKMQLRLLAQPPERIAQRSGTTYSISTANIGRQNKTVATTSESTLTCVVEAELTDEPLVIVGQTEKQLPQKAQTQPSWQFDDGCFAHPRDSDNPEVSRVSKATSNGVVGENVLTPTDKKYFHQKDLEPTAPSGDFEEGNDIHIQRWQNGGVEDPVEPRTAFSDDEQLQLEATRSIDWLAGKRSEATAKSKLEVSHPVREVLDNSVRIISIKQESQKQVEKAVQLFEVTFLNIRVEIEGCPDTLVILFQQMQDNPKFAEQVLQQAQLYKQDLLKSYCFSNSDFDRTYATVTSTGAAQPRQAPKN